MDQYRGDAAVGDRLGYLSSPDQEKANGCKMNRKQLLILVGMALVIGGLGLVLYNQKTASWKEGDQAMGQKILKDFPLNDIAQVRIKQPDTELNLAKTEDQWTVKERWNYPANFSEIGDLLRKMWELKSVQTLRVGPSQYGRLELLSPEKEKGTNTGTLLEFKDKSGKSVRSLLVGKKVTRTSENPSPMGGGDYPVGRYVALPDNPQNVWLISDTLSDVEAKPDRWLNKDFFKVEKLKSISVTHTNATNSWKIAREKEGGDLDLADKKPGEEFDKNKAYSAGNALSYPSFTDVLNPAAKPDETGMDHPIVAKLETFDNFTYTVEAAKAKGTNDDNYNLHMTVNADLVKQRTPGKDEKPEDKDKLDKEFQDKLKKLEDKFKQEKSYEKWTYLVSKWTIDPLLKERKDFLAEKKADDKKPDDKKTDQSKADDIKLDSLDTALQLQPKLPALPAAQAQPKPAVNTNAVSPVVPPPLPPEPKAEKK
jgi:hypothetical protein